jgi:SAM-dependent methyltransferase
MKLRESGMPEEAYWETLFDVPLFLDRLGIDARLRSVVEFGCGYGTFTVPVARRISGVLTTFDIDAAMVERTRQRAAAAGAYNVLYVVRDVFAHGFGGEAGNKDACLLFNILHCEEPLLLLAEAVRVVQPGGGGAGDSLASRPGNAAGAEPGDSTEAGADRGMGDGDGFAGGRGAGD